MPTTEMKKKSQITGTENEGGRLTGQEPSRPVAGNLPDEELIGRFQQGDIFAYEILVKRHKERLFNFVYRFMGDSRDSEDIVQETFVRLYVHKDSYHPSAKFITWLFTIAGNLAKSELRKRKIRNVFSIHKYSGRGDAESRDREIEVVDPGMPTDQRVDAKLKDEAVQKAILALPQQFREAVVLRDVQDFSYEEISEMLKVPVGTVKSRVNRGRLRLQELLGPIRD